MIRNSALILGARSDIGVATAHGLAAAGYPVVLAARNVAGLEAEKQDIQLRYGVEVTLAEFDVLNTDSFGPFIASLPDLPEIAVCAVGLMGDQDENEVDTAAAQAVFRSNFEGPAQIFALLGSAFAERGAGTLVGISSVAGVRGRASNYVYGSAKAGFTAFLSGLRNRLYDDGVHVVTVLPGFVNTQMTAGMDLPARLTAEPEEVGEAIVKAVQKRKNVIYVKPIWQLIMSVIRNIPEGIFKKTQI
ncbi:SDR family oxidoreductase [Ruegeria sp.]|uniref:SDR family oxidoreductase n=1 Tax=Ruegeria sp. TaxID=1879320 RepID=UPI003B5C6A82